MNEENKVKEQVEDKELVELTIPMHTHRSRITDRQRQLVARPRKT